MASAITSRIDSGQPLALLAALRPGTARSCPPPLYQRQKGPHATEPRRHRCCRARRSGAIEAQPQSALRFPEQGGEQIRVEKRVAGQFHAGPANIGCSSGMVSENGMKPGETAQVVELRRGIAPLRPTSHRTRHGRGRNPLRRSGRSCRVFTL